MDSWRNCKSLEFRHFRNAVGAAGRLTFPDGCLKSGSGFSPVPGHLRIRSPVRGPQFFLADGGEIRHVGDNFDARLADFAPLARLEQNQIASTRRGFQRQLVRLIRRAWLEPEMRAVVISDLRQIADMEGDSGDGGAVP